MSSTSLETNFLKKIDYFGSLKFSKTKVPFLETLLFKVKNSNNKIQKALESFMAISGPEGYEWLRAQSMNKHKNLFIFQKF